MNAYRNDVKAQLERVWAKLGPEERETVLLLAERIYHGQKVYGVLDLARDDRTWRKERSEELQDFLIYSAYAEIAATKKGVRAPAPAPRAPSRELVAWVFFLVIVAGITLLAAAFFRG